MAERRARGGTSTSASAQHRAEAGDYHVGNDDFDDDDSKSQASADGWGGGKRATGSNSSTALINKLLLLAICGCLCLIVHSTLKFRVEARLSEQCDRETEELVTQVSAAQGRVAELTDEKLRLERQADKIKNELRKWEDKKTIMHREVERLVSRYMDLKKEKGSLLARHEESQKDKLSLVKEEAYLQELLATTRAKLANGTLPLGLSPSPVSLKAVATEQAVAS